jgi:phosphatidylethanolamine/phosphatidyl-N-methylethanolamine N-methyltransferase
MFMNETSTRKIYNIWSHFYDKLASNLVLRRHRLAVPRMNIQSGQRVLDVGIGTGLSLESYPKSAHVVGVDICEGMLRHAIRRAEESKLASANICVADALELPFEQGSFDHVFISHVITVVSNPVKLIEEIRRVAKPGGRIVIINHFQSGNRVIGAFEKWLCPLFVKIGFKSDLSLEKLIQDTGVQVDFRYKLDQVDFWETVFITNEGSPSTQVGALAVA